MTLNRSDWALTLITVLLVTAGIAVAAGIGGRQQLTSGSALDKAGAAALASTGGGRVTESEVSEDKQGYEVEVTLNNGQKVEVRLDANFKVTGQEADDDDDEKEDGPDNH
jgi:hypothetical protein